MSSWSSWLQGHRADVDMLVDNKGYAMAAELLGCPKGLMASFQTHARPSVPKGTLDAMIQETKSSQVLFRSPNGRLKMGKWMDAHLGEVEDVAQALGNHDAAIRLDIPYSTLCKRLRRSKLERQAAQKAVADLTSAAPIAIPTADEFKAETGFDLPEVLVQEALDPKAPHDRYVDSLYETIRDHSTTPFERIDARARLERIMGATEDHE